MSVWDYLLLASIANHMLREIATTMQGSKPMTRDEFLEAKPELEAMLKESRERIPK